jgi:hypothetical protein
MGRPKKRDDEKLGNLATRVSPETATEIIAIAEKNERSVSWVVRKFVERGLAGYKRDSFFDDPIDTKVEKREMAEVKASANKPRFDAGPSKVPSAKPDVILVDDNFEFDGEPIEIIDENGRRIDKRTGNEIVIVSKDNPPEPDAVLSVDEQGRQILVDVRTGKQIIGIDKQTGEPILENK